MWCATEGPAVSPPCSPLKRHPCSRALPSSPRIHVCLHALTTLITSGVITSSRLGSGFWTLFFDRVWLFWASCSSCWTSGKSINTNHPRQWTRAVFTFIYIFNNVWSFKNRQRIAIVPLLSSLDAFYFVFLLNHPIAQQNRSRYPCLVPD